MKKYSMIFVGGRGSVFALDKATGKQIWEQSLNNSFFKMGSDIVSLLETDSLLYAFTYGKLFCLSKTDGEIRWKSEIPHLKHHVGLLATEGYSNSTEIGIVSIDSSDSHSGDDGD